MEKDGLFLLDFIVPLRVTSEDNSSPPPSWATKMMFVEVILLVDYSVLDPHKVASKSLLVGLEGPVILPSLKDRTGLSLMVSDYVAYEIMVRSHYVQIMTQTLPEQPESEKQAMDIDITLSASLKSTSAGNNNKLYQVD